MPNIYPPNEDTEGVKHDHWYLSFFTSRVNIFTLIGTIYIIVIILIIMVVIIYYYYFHFNSCCYFIFIIITILLRLFNYY